MLILQFKEPKRLIEDGVILADPSEGVVVCGDEGYGKLAEISIIQKMILDLYQRNF